MYTSSTFYSDYIDAYIGISTALLALIIWIREEYKSWNEHLPKKLTVHFKLQDRYVYTCHEALLTGISDIRQWGQQIGSQMNGQNLNFYPYFDVDSPILKKEKNHSFFNHYTIVFYLKTNPNNDEHYKVWWENDSNAPENKEMIYLQRPEAPISIIDAEKDYKSQTIES
jgi:hypothetical protein